VILVVGALVMVRPPPPTPDAASPTATTPVATVSPDAATPTTPVATGETPSVAPPETPPPSPVPMPDDRTTLVIAVPVYSAEAPPENDTLIPQTEGIAKAVQLAIDDAEEMRIISPTIKIKLEMRRYEEKVSSGADGPKLAAEQAAREILADLQTRCVVGHYTSTSTGAAVQIYKASGNEKLAVISPSSSATDLTNINTTDDIFLWRLVTTDTNQGFVGARFATEEITKTRAFIVAGTADNQTKAADAFEGNFRELGGRVERPEFEIDPQKPYSFGESLEESEADEIVEQISQWSIENGEDGLIYLAVNATTANLIFDKMLGKGIVLPVIGIDSLDRPGSNYPSVNFEVYITTMAMPSDFGRGKEFAARTGQSLSYAAEAYDAAMLCIQGIASSTPGGIPSRAEVLASIRSITAEEVSLRKYYAVEDTYAFWNDAPSALYNYGDLRDFKLFMRRLIQGETNPLRETAYQWDRSLEDRNNRRWVKVEPTTP
jgi:ABC-type branched-subunit amino acid transport system substrate-binding protein